MTPPLESNPLWKAIRDDVDDLLTEGVVGRLPAFGGHRAGTPSGLSRFASQAIRLLIPGARR